jgi:hypothetical protein
MTKGIATDARAIYFKTREMAADFASLSRRWNTVVASWSREFTTCDLPSAPSTNPAGRGGQGCHRLIFNRSIERCFAFAG